MALEFLKPSLHYTRDTTSKCVASGGVHLHGLAPGLRKNVAAVVSCWRHRDLTNPGFEPQVSRIDSYIFTTELTPLKDDFRYSGCMCSTKTTAKFQALSSEILALVYEGITYESPLLLRFCPFIGLLIGSPLSSTIKSSTSLSSDASSSSSSRIRGTSGSTWGAC